MIRFQTQFTANHTNVVYRVDVIDKDYSGAIGELRGTRDWMQFSHQRIDPRRYTEIQQGELRLNVFTEGNVAFRNQITSARENRFELHLYEGGVLKWKGAVLPDLCSYTEHPDERLTIVAKDFTLLKSSFFALEDNRELVIDTIRKILNPLGYSIPYVTSTSWTNANMNDAQDFLRQTYHETRAFRIFGDIDSEITREEALKWILRNYGLTLKQWGGFRLDQFTAQGASVFRAVYGASGSPSSEGVVGASHTVDKITTGSSNQALPGVKRVINTFNHRSQTERPTLPRFIALQQNESDTRTFTISYTGEETLSLRARITANTLATNFNSGRVRMTLRAGAFYWNGTRWVEQAVDFEIPLFGGELQSDFPTQDRRAFVGTLSVETTEVPEDNPFEITFRNAQLRQDQGDFNEATDTLFDSLELELGGLADDNAITYQLVQGDTFTEELRIQETYFGDGPLKGSVSALRYSPSLDDVTQEDWRRRGTSTQRLFHSNLLHEFLDGRRGSRRLLNADIIGGFQPENNLSYDGGLLYYTGGTLDGQTGRWNAQLVAITIEDLNEQVDRIASEGVGSGGFGQAVNFSLENLRRILLLTGAVGVTTSDYTGEENSGTGITEIDLDLNQPLKEGFVYWVINSSQLNARSVYDGIYEIQPDVEGYTESGEVTIPLITDPPAIVDAPAGSLVILAPSQTGSNQLVFEDSRQLLTDQVSANTSAIVTISAVVGEELEDIDSLIESLIQLQTDVDAVIGDVEVNTGAIQTINSRVTVVEDEINVLSQSVTTVEAGIGELERTADGSSEVWDDTSGIWNTFNEFFLTGAPANARGLNLLRAVVNQQGDDITVQAQSLTAIQSRLEFNGFEFTAGAFLNLETNVSAIDGQVTAISQALLQVQSRLEFNGFEFTAGAFLNLETNVSAIDGQVTAISQALLQVQTDFQDFEGDTNTAIAGLQLEVGNIEQDLDDAFDDIGTIGGRAVLFTDTNGNIASIELLSGTEGSAIDINASQVKINGVLFDDNGMIRSTSFDGTIVNGIATSLGTTGWSIDRGGQIVAHNIRIRGGDIEGFDLSGNVGAIRVVNTLPASGEYKGESVYVKNQPDKLYRWDGDEWISTLDGADLLANSVTAGKINVATLSAIQANLGNVTVGGSVGGSLTMAAGAVIKNASETYAITDGGITVLGGSPFDITLGANGEITNSGGDFSLSSNGLSLQEGAVGARRIEWYAGSSLKGSITTVNSGTVGGVANTRSFSIQVRNESSGNMEVVANLNAQRIDFEKSVIVNGNLVFAGSNRIADLSGGQYLELPRRTTDPTGVAGRIYFNTLAGILKYHDGAGWRTLV